ncbi:MAG: diaminopimelate epimerase, partial [Gaiellales bacterium]
MRFSKWHGLGNDYLVIERAEAGGPLAPPMVQRLCDRHQGVGADGVLEIVAVEGSLADIVIWNPDGSTAELSGNGTRIVARWLARHGDRDDVRVRVASRTVDAIVGRDGVVEQALGPVAVGAVEDLELEDEVVEFTPVSVGNPHAVLRHDPRPVEVRRLGPLIEEHRRFPDRTNVQLVRVDGIRRITVGVWERGAGETRSSGTSAAAAAAAAVANGWCGSPVEVRLPGGEL